MHPHRFALTFAVALVTLAGCSAIREDPAGEQPAPSEIESALTLPKSRIRTLGAISYGDVETSVAYASPPRYRAYSFVARAGDAVDLWVRSKDGDAYAYLTDASLRVLASNDDADATTTDAHVTSTLASAGAYFVVFREASLKPATFDVSLSNAGATVGCDPSTLAPPRSISSGGDASWDVEPDVANDGRGSIVAVWIAYVPSLARNRLGYAISRDRGATFSKPSHLDLPPGVGAGDPTVAVDSRGGFYACFLGSGASGAHVYLASLPPAATAFGAPTIVSSDAADPAASDDRPRLTIDGGDDLLVTWNDTRAASFKTMFTRSTDGARFSTPLVLASGPVGLSSACVDRAKGGATPIYVSYYDGGKLSVLRSIDRGASFAPSSSSPIETGIADQGSQCIVRGDEVLVAFARAGAAVTGADNQPASAIALARSSDAGKTFPTITTVFPSSAGVQYFFPLIFETPSSALELAVYRVASGKGALVRARSTDGVTFGSPSTLGSTGPFSNVRGATGWYGDYMGFSSERAGRAFAVFGDGSSGTSRVSFAAECAP